MVKNIEAGETLVSAREVITLRLGVVVRLRIATFTFAVTCLRWQPILIDITAVVWLQVGIILVER